MRWKHLLRLLAYTIHGTAMPSRWAGMCRSPPIEVVHLSRCSWRDSEVYQTGLVRVAPKADAIGNRVGFAVIEAAVIPNPEEICILEPSHFGPMTATPSAFVGNAPREQCHLQSQSHNCRQLQSGRDRQSTGEIRYSSPQGVFVLGAPGPTCTFILVQEHWSLSEAEE